MKSGYVLTLLAATLLSTTAFATTSPTSVPITFKKVYVPDGFDSNDSVQIVAEGTLPNTCYRYADTAVEVDQRTKTILLNPTAYQYQGVCLMMMLNYNHEINLGILKEGNYTIVQGQARKLLGTINITAAKNPEADDYLYAPVAQTSFNSGCFNDLVMVSGNLPLKCLKVKEVKSHAQPDVFVVQPIIEADPTIPCEEGSFPFETSVSAAALPKGRYLIHVRSSNGKALNLVVDKP